MSKFFFLALALLLASPLEEILTSYLTASLLRAEGDPDVYYVKDGKRHWIDSPELFKIHALPWKEVEVVQKSDLIRYEEGEKVTESSSVILPGEEEKLPDLVAFPARQMHLKKQKDRLLLMFTTTIWNKGKGPLELLPGKSIIADGEEEVDVSNRVYRENGTYRDKLVGNFKWHAAKGHNHYHLNDFADYVFERIDGGGPDNSPTMKEKVSFCVLDELPINLALVGAPQKPQFPNCPKTKQGLSVGWADDYEYDLAGQNFDITDFAPGVYQLTFNVNPRNRFVEARDDNNKSFAIFTLDPPSKKLEILATAGAFEGASSFPNGSLLRSEKDGKVYIIHNNKRRWLRSESVVKSYGSSLGILDVPESILESIAYNNLMRSQDGKVYALNDFGYKRHIRSSEIFASYNLSWDDVADVSIEEFSQYKDARLVRVDGEGVFYQVKSEVLEPISYVDAFYANGFSKDEVHTINKTDFESYQLYQLE